jgi:hypothetical protein
MREAGIHPLPLPPLVNDTIRGAYGEDPARIRLTTSSTNSSYPARSS